MRSLIVLPTYQEADNVATVLFRIRESLPEAHVLVVDDASPDGTADIARRTGEEVGGVDILQRAGKGGLGSAYRDGMRWALARGFDAVVEMDADLSHDPRDLPRLVGALVPGVDLAVGSRYVPGGSIPAWSWSRRILSRQGNRYAAAVLGLPVSDATSGFRAYRASRLAEVDLDRVRADGYGFQIEMVYRILRGGGAVVEVPICFTERVRGQSKMSSRIVIEALVLVTWWGMRDRLVSLVRRSKPG